jgi:predicted phosphate transport protein (TIGR00153 family)
VDHARKVHECVSLVKPVAEAILAEDAARLEELHTLVSTKEFEADQIKDEVRVNLPTRYYLPVDRDDLARFLSSMDKIADDAEDFSVMATFRPLRLPKELHAEFLALAEKVVAVSECLLGVAEHIADIQKGGFTGPDAEEVLKKIAQVCHMEFESDKINRQLAKHAYGMMDLDPVTMILLDKLCRSLSKLADHAENVGKNLRLMITRK